MKRSSIQLLILFIVMIGLQSNLRIYGTTTGEVDTPIGVRGTATESTIIISWQGVANSTYYEVLVNGLKHSTTTTSLTLTGLSSDTDYAYQVRAVSGDATSAYSALKSIRTDSEIPSIPTGVTALATDTSITVSWNEIIGARSYDVKINGAVNNTSGTSYTYSELISGADYTYSVRAKNGLGSSAYSAAQTITTETKAIVLTAPVGLSATATERTITFTWQKVDGATSYTVQLDGVPYYAASNTYTWTSLTPGRDYRLSVNAVSSDDIRVNGESSENIGATSRVLLVTTDAVEEEEEVVEVEVTVIEEEEEEIIIEEVEEVEEEIVQEETLVEEVEEEEAIEGLVDQVEESDTDIDNTSSSGSLEDNQLLISGQPERPILLNVVDGYIHQSHEAMALAWLKGGISNPDTYSLRVYNDQSVVVYEAVNLKGNDASNQTVKDIIDPISGEINRVSLGDYHYTIPGKVFQSSGDYVVALTSQSSDGIDSLPKTVHITALAGTEARVATRAYAQLGSEACQVNGYITTLSMEAIEEYGFKWGPSTSTELFQAASTKEDSHHYSAVISALDPQKKYYYRAYVKKKDGTIVLGSMNSFVTTSKVSEASPVINDVRYEASVENGVTTYTYTVSTDLSSEAVVFWDEQGHAMKYLGDYEDINGERYWRISRIYRQSGLYSEEIAAVNTDGISPVTTELVLVGKQGFVPIKVDLKKEEYKHYVGSSRKIRLLGEVSSLKSNDQLERITFRVNGSLAEGDTIVDFELREDEVDLSREALTIDGLSYPFDQPGIYTISIYATSEAYQECPLPLGQVTVYNEERLNVELLDTIVSLKNGLEELRITGEVTPQDGSHIEALAIGVGDTYRKVYRKAWYSPRTMSTIELDESFELDLEKIESVGNIVVYVLLNDGSVSTQSVDIAALNTLTNNTVALNK